MTSLERIKERQLSLPEPFLESLDWTPGQINTGHDFEDFVSKIYNSPIDLGLARAEGKNVSERLRNIRNRPIALVTENGTSKLLYNEKYIACTAEKYLAIIRRTINPPFTYSVYILTSYGVTELVRFLRSARGQTFPLTPQADSQVRRKNRQLNAWDTAFPPLSEVG